MDAIWDAKAFLTQIKNKLLVIFFKNYWKLKRLVMILWSKFLRKWLLAWMQWWQSRQSFQKESSMWKIFLKNSEINLYRSLASLTKVILQLLNCDFSSNFLNKRSLNFWTLFIFNLKNLENFSQSFISILFFH